MIVLDTVEGYLCVRPTRLNRVLLGIPYHLPQKTRYYVHLPKWIYNSYIRLYNIYIAVYNLCIDCWNDTVSSDKYKEGALSLEQYNQYVDEYNQSVDNWNRNPPKN